MSDNLVAQPRLRWVKRASKRRDFDHSYTLQQFFAQDIPSYMRDVAKGEWRDVEVVVEPET
jgi:hypothetical protein